jgi:monofunctional biosynthetic peptidoglycan transglycosylase
VILWFVLVSVIWVLAYRFINPPITLLMVQRNWERSAADKPSIRWRRKWVKFDDISDNMKRAAVSAEDAVVFEVTWALISLQLRKPMPVTQKKKGRRLGEEAPSHNKQQKMFFCGQDRSYVYVKAFEAYFTLLIELLWSKERILEVYLNVIEMGDGIYGAEAATQAYYGKSCNNLTRSEAALIAACFPNPRRWTPRKPTGYIRHKQYLIMRNMRRLGPLDF